MVVTRDGIEDILLEMGVINTSQLKNIWELQSSTKKDIEAILIENQFVHNTDLLKAKAKKAEVEYVDLKEYELESTGILSYLKENIVKRYGLIPLGKNGNILTVAMKDPTDIFALDDLRLSTMMEIKPVLSDSADIDLLINKYYARPSRVKEAEVRKSQNITPELSIDDKAMKNISAGEAEINRPPITRGKLGNILLDSGIISNEQLEDALNTKARAGGKLGEILVSKGYISRKLLFDFLEKQMEIPQVDLDNIKIPYEVIKLVNPNIARRYKLIPVEIDGYMLKVAMSDPLNIFSMDDLRLATGLEIVPLLADENQITALIDKYYDKNADKKTTVQKKKVIDFEEVIKKVNEEIIEEIENENKENDETININDVDNAPVVKMVNLILSKAVDSGASDIHIEPYEDIVIVRYRIDGQLFESMSYDKKIMSALVARIKILSGLNIAEKRLPQDGRISINIEGKPYDMRVSVLPLLYGEKIVIRIADKEGFNVSKTQLGFFEDDLQKFDEILSNPNGIVLVTGPTGSGKSTTLYSALKELCKPNINILTVEDPIESTIRGVNQVQVNVKTGMTFAVALRAFLRQDPDIIMVGEIRDGETAEIATRAAITGHLVLSTLHTNDAASSITRMIDMGIEPFLLSSSIAGVVAQRLVRRLCSKCRQEYAPGINEKDVLGLKHGENLKIYKSLGCNECNNTGYKGRIAVYEIMTISKEIKALISKSSPDELIKAQAIKEGMKTLKANCSRLVKNGLTSVEEMLRITYIKE